MKTRSLRTFLSLAAAVLLGATAASAQTPASHTFSARTMAQINAINADADARTPVQRKITWSLLYATKEKVTRSVPVPGAPKLHSRVALEADGRVKVKITADVTAELLAAIHTQGGDVTRSFPKDRAVYATLPLERLETIAARPDVVFIGLPQAPHYNGAQQTSLPRALRGTVQAEATVNDPEGDVAHGANIVRSEYGITGAGLKVGVLSDSLDDPESDYESALLNGYVSSVTVPGGQAGSSTEDGEGLAMLEDVHRLAPEAQLFFATADGGEEQMAANITTLAADGCNVIIDDIDFADESPFQDGVVSQAVDAASASGVLYFSCTANFGNLDSGTSSCWEGDFVGDSQSPTLLDFAGGKSSSAEILNTVSSDDQTVSVWLFWAEPIGGASSSYFLYDVNYEGDITAAGNDQGTAPNQNIPSFTVGDSIGVQMKSGSAEFLHVDIVAQHSSLQIQTAGRVRGHNACPAPNAFSIAATPAATATSGGPTGPYPNEFSSGDGIETFSDDGPRRVFFLPNGTPITPGNSTSTGGRLLAKPDFAAADGVTTSLTSVDQNGNLDLNPFFGTSCAAPHAGALAALLLSYKPTLTPAQVGAAMRGGTVQITNPGPGNRDAGAGILLAPNIIQAVNTPPTIINFNPPNGPVGTIVTITGINLNTATIVDFNGVQAAFSAISSTALTTTVPAGATTGPITLQTAGGNAASPTNFTLTTSVSTPVVSSPAAATGLVGSAFFYQITATNGPTSFGASGLPPGLAVGASGLISGTPSAPGVFPVTIAAGNTAGGASSSVLTLTIMQSPPVITAASVVDAQEDVAFPSAIAATNAPTAFAAAGLPAGLTLDPSTGVISGTPTVSGQFPVTVVAANAGGSGRGTFTLSVAKPPLPILSIKATVPSVQLGSHEKGEFLLTLSKAVNKPTVVSFQITGTAVDGDEYVLLSDTKVIRAGETTKTINIVPRGSFTGTKAVKLVLNPGSDYTIGKPHQAKVKIIGD